MLSQSATSAFSVCTCGLFIPKDSNAIIVHQLYHFSVKSTIRYTAICICQLENSFRLDFRLLLHANWHVPRQSKPYFHNELLTSSFIICFCILISIGRLSSHWVHCSSVTKV